MSIISKIVIMRGLPLFSTAADQAATDMRSWISSVTTVKRASLWEPKVVIIGMSAASRPRAIRTRPIAEEDFEPRVEIHRGRIWRHADVAEVAVAIARRDVETSAQRDGQMSEVAADAYAFRQSLARGPGRARFGIAESETLIDEVADRLHFRPAAR
jgi:hypothetical protein